MQIIVHSRQTLLDVTIQECGSFEAAFTLAARNGISISDNLETGAVLEYSLSDMLNKRVVAAFATRGTKPATTPSPYDEQVAPWGGIGYMGIEIDFIVSQ